MANNAHVRPEVKNVEQIQKEPQKKANKIQYMNNKPTRGKRFGQKGNRGRGLFDRFPSFSQYFDCFGGLLKSEDFLSLTLEATTTRLNLPKTRDQR